MRCGDVTDAFCKKTKCDDCPVRHFRKPEKQVPSGSLDGCIADSLSEFEKFFECLKENASRVDKNAAIGKLVCEYLKGKNVNGEPIERVVVERSDVEDFL